MLSWPLRFGHPRPSSAAVRRRVTTAAIPIGVDVVVGVVATGVLLDVATTLRRGRERRERREARKNDASNPSAAAESEQRESERREQ